MDHTEELTELIGAIYDAALDPRSWNDALTRCKRFLNGSAATLFSKDANATNGDCAYYVGVDTYYKKLYFEKYIGIDPFTAGQYFAKIDVPISASDILPFEDFLETRFYREWAQPQGWVDCITTVVDRSDTSAALFAVFRHERDGLVDDEMRRRTTLIAPHIRRAVMIGRAIDLGEKQTATFADALDALGAGVFFVTANGRITHTNKSARSMLASGDVSSVNRDRLSTIDPACDEALVDVICAAANGDMALATNGISMPLVGRNSVKYVAHVLPLTCGERYRTSVSFAASAAIFVHKPNQTTVAPSEAIAKTFGLTPTELRIFLAVVEIGGAPEIAEALGVSINTVKSHLQRVFSKTGANRQADLVKLFAAYRSPFGG
jgi:DNA-binding CsgD family transcriptional regulator/PAS domain-containing protein